MESKIYPLLKHHIQYFEMIRGHFEFGEVQSFQDASSPETSHSVLVMV